MNMNMTSNPQNCPTSTRLHGQCPVYNLRCTKCSHNGHFTSCPSQKLVRQIEIYTDSFCSIQSQINQTSWTRLITRIPTIRHLSNEPPKLSINSLNSDRKVKLWTANLNTNGYLFDLKFDSSAETNVLLQTLYNKLHRRPKLKSTL